jgi:hypothetical protein
MVCRSWTTRLPSPGGASGLTRSLAPARYDRRRFVLDWRKLGWPGPGRRSCLVQSNEGHHAEHHRPGKQQQSGNPGGEPGGDPVLADPELPRNQGDQPCDEKTDFEAEDHGENPV